MFPKVGKICIGGESSDETDAAFIRFTLIDEPDPPLAYQLALNHIFNMLKTSSGDLSKNKQDTEDRLEIESIWQIVGSVG